MTIFLPSFNEAISKANYSTDTENLYGIRKEIYDKHFANQMLVCAEHDDQLYTFTNLTILGRWVLPKSFCEKFKKKKYSNLLIEERKFV